jgi:hypothetical protein
LTTKPSLVAARAAARQEENQAVNAALLMLAMLVPQEQAQEPAHQDRDLSAAERITGTDLRPIENSLSNIGGTFKSFFDLVVGLPGFCIGAFHWCVDSALWCIYAVLFAYGQRLYMLWFGVWRPKP